MTSCPMEDACDLTEDIINKYDQNQFMEIIELLEKHGIDEDQAEDLSEAQNLLFEHLQNKSGQDAIDCNLRTDIVHNVVEAHHERRTKLCDITKQLLQFVSKLPAKRKKELQRYFPKKNLDMTLKQIIAELDEKKCSFIVAGETGSGKSCFLNLLMGHYKQNFLPVKNTPSTSCLCEITYGPQGKIRAYRTGEENPAKSEELTEENMTEKLSEFTHQKDDRESIKYTKVEVEWPLEWLKSGLTVVDSPGVGEKREITEIVKQMMPKAFGFIYVINTTKAGGIQAGELEDLLLNATEKKDSKDSSEIFDPRTAIFIFNKWDLIPNDERTKVKDFVKGKLKEIWKGIDTDQQMFFMSTQQATDALRGKMYVTEEYRRVLKGIEKLMEFSMRSKLKKHVNFLSELVSRCVFMLKAYLQNLPEFQKKYKMIKDKLESLKTASGNVQDDLESVLKKEVEGIVERLKEYLKHEATRERLCRWDVADCPNDVGAWQGLSRRVNVLVYERIEADIKSWETNNDIFEQANQHLFEVFQKHFESMNDKLQAVEMDLAGNVDDKEVKKMVGHIRHTFMATEDDDLSFTTKEKVLIGATAPLWVPLGIVAGLITAPFIIGWIAVDRMKEKKLEDKRFQNYFNGPKEDYPTLMKVETENILFRLQDGDGLKGVVEGKLDGLVKKYLLMIKKIPEFINADKALLDDMQEDMKEGINVETRNQCKKLLTNVKGISMNMDMFYLLHIHESDLDANDISLGDKIGDGSFGDVYLGVWSHYEGGVTVETNVAVKRHKLNLSEMEASEIKLEHINMKSLQSCDNIIKYYDLCLKKDPKDGNIMIIPMMVMELCDTTLNKMIYDDKQYIGPGSSHCKPEYKNTALFITADFAMQIANGLRFMHEKDMVHRDLKPANILVKTTGDDKTKYNLKICDLGLTKQEEEIQKTVCGTQLYMAPEIHKNEPYDKSSDMFGYGLILLELYYGKLLMWIPFAEVRYIPTRFEGDPLGFGNPPKDWEDTIRPCIEEDPKKRKTAKDCYEFFKQFRRSALYSNQV